MKNINTLCMLLFVLLFTPLIHAQQDANELFDAGTTAYSNGNYSDAAGYYRTLIDSLHIRDAHIYYNLGNSYFRTGYIGKAIVSYERARHLQPRNDDIMTNLLFAQKESKDHQALSQNVIFIRLLFTFLATFTLNEVVWFASFTYLLVAILISIGIIKGFTKSLLVKSLILSVIICVLATGMSATKIYREHILKHAIVITPKTEVYSGPDTKFTLRFILHEGSRLVIEKEQDGWRLIRLNNGEKGWLPLEDVEIL